MTSQCEFVITVSVTRSPLTVYPLKIKLEDTRGPLRRSRFGLQWAARFPKSRPVVSSCYNFANKWQWRTLACQKWCPTCSGVRVSTQRVHILWNEMWRRYNTPSLVLTLHHLHPTAVAGGASLKRPAQVLCRSSRLGAEHFICKKAGEGKLCSFCLLRVLVSITISIPLNCDLHKLWR